MGYEIMRIFYALWVLGALVFTFNALSVLIFGKRSKAKRLRALIITPFFCAIWPLSLCSQPGRKVLFGKFNQL